MGNINAPLSHQIIRALIVACLCISAGCITPYAHPPKGMKWEDVRQAYIRMGGERSGYNDEPAQYLLRLYWQRACYQPSRTGMVRGVVVDPQGRPYSNVRMGVGMDDNPSFWNWDSTRGKGYDAILEEGRFSVNFSNYDHVRISFYLSDFRGGTYMKYDRRPEYSTSRAEQLLLNTRLVPMEDDPLGFWVVVSQRESRNWPDELKNEQAIPRGPGDFNFATPPAIHTLPLEPGFCPPPNSRKYRNE